MGNRPIDVEKKDDQTQLEATTEFFLKSSTLAAHSIDSAGKSIAQEHIDFQYAKKILEDSFKKVKAGELSSIEEILFTQSYALNVMFASMVARSSRQEYIANSQALMALALKAQNQSRATLQTLIQLKQPSQTSFIKQQTNVAGGHQQINNGISFPENLSNKPNELLETQDGKWLDAGAKGQNALANSSLEALGKVHRGKDNRRKGKIQ